MANNVSTRRRGLGRGLGALIQNTAEARPLQSAPADQMIDASGAREVAIDQIVPNPRQPRAKFDETALEELATSIRSHGVIQPLIVTQNPERADNFFLIAGERRWRAARLAELETVPVIVREASSSQLIEWALIENIQREDLNPLEEASAYQTLIEEFGLTQDRVAERVGKSRPTIANAVRLLRLPSLLQQAVIDELISAGHARALLSLEDEPAMAQAFEIVTQRGLNVRQTEALVKQLLTAAATPSPQAREPVNEPMIEPHIAHLENRFRMVLGTRVNLARQPNGSGRLVIHFYSDDDLAQLYELIAGGDEPE